RLTPPPPRPGCLPAGANLAPATGPLNVNTAGMGMGSAQSVANERAEAARRAAGPPPVRPVGYAGRAPAPAVPRSPQQSVANRASARIRNRYTPPLGRYEDRTAGARCG